MKQNLITFWRGIGRTHPVRGAVAFMLVSTFGFSLMNVCVRLAAESMDAGLIVTLRNLVTLVLLLPLVAPQRFVAVRTRRLRDHFTRSVTGVIGMLSWTYCLTVVPLAHATALSFTAPLLASLLAVLILKEPFSSRHSVALVAGMLGVLIILRPTAEGFDHMSVFVMLAATSWAVTSLFIKSLSATEPPLAMVFYMNLFMTVLALPLGIAQWHLPNAHEMLMILAIALCSLVMHFTMVGAYALVPVTTLMPFDFLRLVHSSILAYLIFGERFDGYSWLGAAIILAGVTFATTRKRKAEPVEPV